MALVQFCLFVLALTVAQHQVLCGTQSYAVKGQLMCDDKPANDVRVKLIDNDSIGSDDELDAGYTDANGDFSLSGDTSEMGDIDPVFKAYHDCNDGITLCQRKWRFKLPKKHITKGKDPKKVVNLGTWNLEVEIEDEDHDCSH